MLSKLGNRQTQMTHASEAEIETKDFLLVRSAIQQEFTVKMYLSYMILLSQRDEYEIFRVLIDAFAVFVGRISSEEKRKYEV